MRCRVFANDAIATDIKRRSAAVMSQILRAAAEHDMGRYVRTGTNCGRPMDRYMRRELNPLSENYVPTDVTERADTNAGGKLRTVFDNRQAMN